MSILAFGGVFLWTLEGWDFILLPIAAATFKQGKGRARDRILAQDGGWRRPYETGPILVGQNLVFGGGAERHTGGLVREDV